MTGRLGTHALVTGASRGVGPVIALALAGAGVDVTLAARSSAGLEQTAASIGSRVRVHTHAMDLRDQAARIALIADAQDRLGPVDILVNNAAADHYTAFRAQPVEQMREEIETNLLAPLHLTNLVLEGMLERGTGHIVNLASVSGKLGLAYKATYSATKAGLIEWATALRAELYGTGVEVSVILPGFVRDVGVFSRQGVPVPKLAGSVTGEQVALAVLRAVRDGAGEIIVTPTPTRPSLALDALWPSFGNWLLRRVGVIAVTRELATRSSPSRRGFSSDDAKARAEDPGPASSAS